MNSIICLTFIIVVQKMSVVTDKRLRRGSPPWSDLPYDILCCIMGHLCFVDQIQFRAVCKNFGLVAGIRPKDKLPWVLTLNFSFKNDMYPSSLYDPCTLEAYKLDHELTSSSSSGVVKLQVCGARNGWLLLAEITPFFFFGHTDFYLYNPFTDDASINLPRLRTKEFKATFTSNLTSQDCLFFAIHADEEREKVMCISTCSHGDRKWTESLAVEGNLKQVIGVVYIKGIFYCIFKTGMLGSFNPVTKKWNLLISENTNSSELRSLADSFEARFVESDGEVLLVYSKRSYKPWHIFRLDWLQMTWVKEVSLGNRVLFLGDISFLISAEGEIKDLSDRIYYHGFRRSYFYPIKSGIGQIRSHSLIRQSCKHYEDRSPHMLRVWIEPPTLL